MTTPHGKPPAATRLFHAIVLVSIAAPASWFASGCGAPPGAGGGDAAIGAADDGGTSSDAMEVEGDAMEVDVAVVATAEPDVDAGWAPTK
jgi:hypothetical protein